MRSAPSDDFALLAPFGFDPARFDCGRFEDVFFDDERAEAATVLREDARGILEVLLPRSAFTVLDTLSLCRI